MFIFPKEENAWRHRVEMLVLRLDVEIKRLWRRIQQVPQPQAGAPFGEFSGLAEVSRINLPSGTSTETGAPASLTPDTQWSDSGTPFSGSADSQGCGGGNYCEWRWNKFTTEGSETASGAGGVIQSGNAEGYWESFKPPDNPCPVTDPSNPDWLNPTICQCPEPLFPGAYHGEIKRYYCDYYSIHPDLI